MVLSCNSGKPKEKIFCHEIHVPDAKQRDQTDLDSADEHEVVLGRLIYVIEFYRIDKV